MSSSKTPLRYPGGKQKLTPFIVEILEQNNLLGGHYVEPYAGGAGAAMELLFSKKVSFVHLNDSSLAVYSFWNSILNQSEEFCDLIRSASMSIEEWRRQKEIINNPENYSELELGFSTFYLNRCNRSGVITGGVIGGLDQIGTWKMDARFNRNDLITRIEAIASRKDSIHISNLDAEEYIREYIPTTPVQTLVYCDPPYYEKSSGLYLDKYKKKDHKRLSETIQQELGRRWILSYDGADEILSYYTHRRYFLYDLQYNASKVYKGREVFIFDDNVDLPSSSKLAYIKAGLEEFALLLT